MGDVLSNEEVLAMVPQQEPFRFIDEIVELSEDHIVARYTFREDADFYRGHFPGNPITPGVILTETAAQAAVVAFGIALVARESVPRRGRQAAHDLHRLHLRFLRDGASGRAGHDDREEEVSGAGRSSAPSFEMKLDDGTVVCFGRGLGNGSAAMSADRNQKRVVVTGIGVIAPNANGVGAFEEALRAGRSGIKTQASMIEAKFGCNRRGFAGRRRCPRREDLR